MDWFLKQFLVSFDECKDKQITAKQIGIFRKYFDMLYNDVKVKKKSHVTLSGEFIEQYTYDGYIYTLHEKRYYNKSGQMYYKYYLDVEEQQEDEY